MQGSCHLACIPLRGEPSSKSELVSQVLFGETYQVHDQQGNWYKVLTDFDNYHGWINHTQMVPAAEKTGETVYVQSPVAELSNGNERMFLPAGATLQQNEEGQILHNGKGWKLTGQVRKPATTPNRDVFTSDAMQFAGMPYLWGGRTFMGMDCSAFTQLVYKLNGIALPRDAYQQAMKGTPLSFLDETQPGDLAFFDNDEGKIVHVGILLDPRRIIHAHGSVRTDKIDQQGIFNVDTGRYTHKLRLIRKVI